MNDPQSGRGRREFLKTAGVLVAGAACAPSGDAPDAVETGAETERDGASRMRGFAGPTLTALGEQLQSVQLRPPRRHRIRRQIPHVGIAVAMHLLGDGFVSGAPLHERRHGSALPVGAEYGLSLIHI